MVSDVGTRVFIPFIIFVTSMFILFIKRSVCTLLLLIVSTYRKVEYSCTQCTILIACDNKSARKTTRPSADRNRCLVNPLPAVVFTYCFVHTNRNDNVLFINSTPLHVWWPLITGNKNSNQ